MFAPDLDSLRAEITQAVPPQGGAPKVQGPRLHQVLQHLVDALSAAPAAGAWRTSLLFANGDDLVGPDFWPGAGWLTGAALSPGAAGLLVSVDDGASYQALPVAAGGTWQGGLALPAGASVWYQVVFAAGATSAGVLLTVQDLAVS